MAIINNNLRKMTMIETIMSKKTNKKLFLTANIRKYLKDKPQFINNIYGELGMNKKNKVKTRQPSPYKQSKYC